VSVSDPDTQRMKANRGYVQGYNAQAVVDEGQIVLAAEDHQHPRGLPNLDAVVADKHIQVLIPPDSAGRDAPRPG
jgi:hypothetical protein